MEIKFKDNKLSISNKTKITDIYCIVITQETDGKFSVWVKGFNLKSETKKVSKIEFSGLVLKSCRINSKFEFSSWIEEKNETSKCRYINYYTLPKF